MKILLDFDPPNEETTVTIHCNELTPAIQEILGDCQEKGITLSSF